MDVLGVVDLGQKWSSCVIKKYVSKLCPKTFGGA